MCLLYHCVRALLCEGDMIKHHLRLWYRSTLMSPPLQQMHETYYCSSLLHGDWLLYTVFNMLNSYV